MNPKLLSKNRHASTQDELGLDLYRSVLVGDKDSDIEAGVAAGVKSNIKLVPSGKHDPGRLEFPSLQSIGAWLSRTATSCNQQSLQVMDETGSTPDIRYKQK
jgi:histidinol phosphatase-like enzyme